MMKMDLSCSLSDFQPLSGVFKAKFFLYRVSLCIRLYIF